MIKNRSRRQSMRPLDYKAERGQKGGYTSLPTPPHCIPGHLRDSPSPMVVQPPQTMASSGKQGQEWIIVTNDINVMPGRLMYKFLVNFSSVPYINGLFSVPALKLEDRTWWRSVPQTWQLSVISLEDWIQRSLIPRHSFPCHLTAFCSSATASPPPASS